uniref:Immunoglobulin V-set domain-containing protein n=1 Tax=Oreochromis niloticus TaxID=8128 RepID=A0A669BR67_ORENI
MWFMCLNSSHSQAWLLISLFFSSSVCLKVGHRISKVSVKAGKSISIPCLYESQYKNHVKYLCEGYYWTSCSYAVETNKPDPSGKYLISDDKKQNIFTVTINNGLRTKDSGWYWCAKGDIQIPVPVYLTVTEKPITSTTTDDNRYGTPQPLLLLLSVVLLILLLEVEQLLQ